MKLPIYLDYNATTPVDTPVLEAMLPYFTEHFGNASSKTHAFGWKAAEAVTHARNQVASLLGARANEIVFTSGATESDNLAILGAAEKHGDRKRHIVTSAAEHKAVIDPAKYLEKKGFEVTWLRPDCTGRIAPHQVEEALRDDTCLVSLMLANNEVGTLNPIREIGQLTRARGVLLHVDAAQGAGKIPVNVEDLAVDLLSLSAHKLYGPKGVGALYVRQRDPKARIAPVLFGGGQELGIRPGTQSVPLIVGLGAACAVFDERADSEMAEIRRLADRLADGLTAMGGVTRNGHPTERLPGTVHVSVEGTEAEAMLMSLPDIALSAGAACTTTKPEPSHVLSAMGLAPEAVFSSVRLAVGRHTREDEIDFAVERIRTTTARLRG